MPGCRVAIADVDRPPDTSRLALCDEAEAAAAVEKVRERLLRRRKALLERSGAPGELDSITSRLRRLQNPHLCAYRDGASVLLSEPFNAISTKHVGAETVIAAHAVGAMLGQTPPLKLVRTLAAFGAPALERAVLARVRITLVPDGRRYSDFSPSVAALVPGIDEWSMPPSGLFVVEERRVLLRTRAMSMTAAHEFAHALDAMLATRERSYFSYESAELRHYFSTATGFVNEYAASGLDEYFAESVRAYLEINDSCCAWLPLTRKDLFSRDPRMFEFIERLFKDDLMRRA